MARALATPVIPCSRILQLFKDQAETQLELNAITQFTFPREVYRGYHHVNEVRRMKGQWYSTGKGAISFVGKVVDPTPTHATLAFSFLDYMRYVDMGVGEGTPYGDVEGGAKARFKNRYIKVWNRREGKSQRPAIMMEMRHVQRRMMDYLVDWWGNDATVKLVETFEGMSPIQVI